MKNDEDKRKKQEELDKLKQMAESIGGAKKDDAADSDQKDNDTKDAAEKEQKNNDEKPEGGEKKSGKVDLAALAAKANSIGKNKS